MEDLIYDSIQEMPDDVLRNNIKLFNGLLNYIDDPEFMLLCKEAIHSWEEELRTRADTVEEEHYYG